ncbi:hypothetical protein PBY51_004698 [Eleginops maclovinus]|uniref:Uncharacterized protein n=1 Tax=Eleginops maclovinus TaxID=56733 RepID=A0AAN7X4M6_ELEMC|nr:hypothetical protein PBY51_004698 [Eleginops maclovinus]
MTVSSTTPHCLPSLRQGFLFQTHVHCLPWSRPAGTPLGLIHSGGTKGPVVAGVSQKRGQHLNLCRV